jgi:propanol-preferring alcohol dehydrogenase
VPTPDRDELLVRVIVCAVCRTDLHLAEGDLPPKRPHVTPGHEVVGTVVGYGESVTGFAEGDRVGVAWLRWTCGECRYCRGGAENLCPNSRYTGWDADGGYAEYCVVPADYAYRLPDGYPDSELAPLLCAGIIGYRALLRADLPPGGRLGVYGFGASAHLAAQVALAQGATVHVLTRSEAARALALELGAASAGPATDAPPEPLDAAILFAPVGLLVPLALRAVRPGGRVVCGGIHMSDIPSFPYDILWGEREIVSVANLTRRDAEEFLRIAPQVPVRTEIERFALADANQALDALRSGRLRGAAVLVPPGRA